MGSPTSFCYTMPVNTATKPVTSTLQITISGSKPVTASVQVSSTVSKNVTVTSLKPLTVSKAVSVSTPYQIDQTLVDLYETRNYLGIDDGDLLIAGIRIYCNSATATTATVGIARLTTGSSPKYMYLKEDGATSHGIKLGNYTTLEQLVEAINSKDRWIATLEGPEAGTPTDLEEVSNTSCLAFTNQIVLNYVNNYSINELIDDATSIIEVYCERHFVLRTYTEIYDGAGSVWLTLNHYPISSITTLELDDTELDSDDYEVYTDEGILYYESVFPADQRNIDIVYSAGYAKASVPGALRRLCFEICAFLYARRIQSPNIKSEKIGAYSYTVMSGGDYGGSTSGLPLDIENRLSKFKQYLLDA